MKSLISIDLQTTTHLQVINNYTVGLLYTERVHTRLTQMSPVSFPDCLHVIAQSIYGFEKLAQYYSYFKVNGSFIGVNW